jgi:hypothetical protein
MSQVIMTLFFLTEGFHFSLLFRDIYSVLCITVKYDTKSELQPETQKVDRVQDFLPTDLDFI